MEQVQEERKIKKKINEAIKYNNESKKYILALLELLRLDDDIISIDIME
jgi:ubiquitin